MKIPRDLSGSTLIKALSKFGYRLVRQSGSHARLLNEGPPRHLVTIPIHKSLPVGLLNSIISDIARHQGIEKESIIKELK